MFSAITLAVTGIVAPLATWSAGSALDLKAQTITFLPIADRTMRDAALVVSASATSGLPVSFHTTGVCDESGVNHQIIAPTSPGPCTVVASQSGDDTTWAAAPAVTRTFNVTKAPQTITFGALSDVSLGIGDIFVSATTSTGFPATFTAAPGSVCTAGGTNGATITLVGAGTCTVKADQAGGPLDAPAPTVSRSFGVTKASQAITFATIPDHSVLDSPVTVSATASSLLPVSFVTTTTSVCTAAGTQITLLTSGTCSVRADQLGNANYDAAPSITRSFDATRAPQTITFGAIANRTMQQSPLTVAATASSNLAVAFTTTTPSVCTASGTNGVSITLVGAGTCRVEADQAGNATFAAADAVVQAFTVTKVDQTITFGTVPDITVGASVTAIATASSGLVVTFTSVTPSACTATGTNGATITRLTAAACTVEANQAGDATYDAAPPATQSLGVSKTPQTITFAPLPSLPVDHAPIIVAATASSNLAVTFTTTTPGVCTAGGANGTTITLTAGGTCTVHADQPGDDLYAAAPVVGRSFTVTKLAQTITFTAPAATTVAHSPVVVVATASSHLAVTITTTTPSVCSAGGPNGARITLLGGGTCTVRAAQPGNARYAAASAVIRQFAVDGPVVTTSQSGYWMLGADGHVYAFGSATDFGSASDPVVALAARHGGSGYWLVDRSGTVHAFGSATYHGGRPALLAGESVSTISGTPSGNGYWLFTTLGRAFAYGDAHFYGDMRAVHLNGPVVASVATPTGHGYYMVGSDGGVFSFGDAHFHGSMGGAHLNRPIVGLSPTPDNRGYWLVASDGGVFAFDAPFRGSLGRLVLNRPVNGLVAYGNGYLMVASDGGVFTFSNKRFVGSLGAHPPAAPIVGIATNGAP